MFEWCVVTYTKGYSTIHMLKKDSTTCSKFGNHFGLNNPQNWGAAIWPFFGSNTFDFGKSQQKQHGRLESYIEHPIIP